jgi:hypothetical protein
VLVARERVRVGAVLEQHARRLDMAVEARQRERLEAVVPEGVRAPGISVQELTQSLGVPERSCLEHVQLRPPAKQLADAVPISAVEGFEQLGHVE